MGPATQAEFSRVIDTTALADKGEYFRYEASAAERATIASWLSLIDLRRLEATVNAAPVSGGGVRLKAVFEAEVVQPCVATLEAVSACLQEAFELLYLPETRDRSAAARAISVDVDVEVDVPEVLVDGRVDAGAAIAEHLVLALDPYPRKPGAMPDPVQGMAGEAQDGPFAALRDLKANC